MGPKFLTEHIADFLVFLIFSWPKYLEGEEEFHLYSHKQIVYKGRRVSLTYIYILVSSSAVVGLYLVTLSTLFLHKHDIVISFSFYLP